MQYSQCRPTWFNPYYVYKSDKPICISGPTKGLKGHKKGSLVIIILISFGYFNYQARLCGLLKIY